MAPPPVSEEQRARAAARSAKTEERGIAEGTSGDVTTESEETEVDERTRIARSLVDKPAFANAESGGFKFTGMGFHVQTPNNPAGTHSADQLGTSDKIPSMGVRPTYDDVDVEEKGYTSQAFGADASDAYGPRDQLEWSEGMPPGVAQNAVVRAIWQGYHKASWKWIVDHRGTNGFEEALDVLLAQHPKMKELPKGDKTWMISGDGAPVKWLRKLDWGCHCTSCCAWWMGPQVATERGRSYPALGVWCAISERRYEAISEVARSRAGGAVSKGDHEVLKLECRDEDFEKTFFPPEP